MAAEAEASREARAKVSPSRRPLSLQAASPSNANNFPCSALFPLKVIAAEGEMKASRALKEASLVIAESPSALQLRYLQTLNTIAAEKNSTIIFPLPLDLMQSFLNR